MAWQAAEPVPFSHKKHGALRRPCVECHAGAETRDRAGWPTPAECQKCHSLETAVTPLMKEVAAWSRDVKPYPLKRLYRARDFVLFSHVRHREAKIACAKCHGEVASMDPLERHRDVSMQACVECHQEHKATLVCNACHDLGQ
jgi:hypothetical protein